MAYTKADLAKIDARIIELEAELQKLRSQRAEMQRSINGGNGGLRVRLAATRKGL